MSVAKSIAFCSRLFGAEPAKTRPGYANFALTEPPLKLVLMENPGQGGTLNHLGVEVTGTEAVAAEAGLDAAPASGAAQCCGAGVAEPATAATQA